MSLQHVANHLAQQGRGNDKMLVHMTPSEVAGLRSLAHAKGGDLTINPHTGLPEAGFLDDVLKAAAPMALGALLGPAGFGLSSMMAGVATGGIMTLATGSLSRGLMAGLGAYGGADIAGNLAAAGTQAAAPGALASAEQGLAAGLGTDVGSEAYKAHLLNNPGALGESVTAQLNAMPQMDKLAGGYNAVTATPGDLGTFAKNNAASGLMAVSPMLADQGVKTTTPAPVNPAYIRQKIYDPVTHHMIDLPAVKASEWGSRNFSDIYQQPATAATGGIVALAQGGRIENGVRRFDVAGAIEAGRSGFAPGTSAQDVVNSYGIQNSTQAQQVAQALGYTGDIGALTYGNTAAASATSPTAATQFVNFVNTQPNASDEVYYRQMQNLGLTPTSSPNLASQIGLSQADFLDRFNLAQDYSKEKTLLGAYQGPATPLANLGSAYDQQYASYMDVHKDPVTGKIDPITVKEISRTTGIPEAQVQARYDAAEAKLHPLGASPPPSTGVPPVAPLIGAAPTGTGGGGPGIIALPKTVTQLPTNPQTNAPVGTSNPYGNKNNPGDLTLNADKTVSVTPNLPARPYAGFSGLGEVTDAWTAGGGSPGYFPKAPKTPEEANKQFNTMTGDSFAAYNFLTGQGTAPLKTSASKVSKSYMEAVLGLKPDEKIYASDVKEIFDPVTHKRIPNPNYDPSVAANAASKTASGAAPSLSTKTISVPGANGTPPKTATQLKDYPGFYFGVDGRYYDANGKLVANTASEFEAVHGANGGLIGMARGGTARHPFFSKTTGKFNFNPPQVYADGGMAMGGLGSLGGYSDGGRLLRGPGDGVSDSIPASIGNRQPARLADGEFVVPARIVSEIGNGSTEAGARKLYAMMDRVQNARAKTTGKKQVATNTNAAKYLPV